MKYASIDIETCGLNETDSIIELGIVLDDLTVQKPPEQLPRFHCYILPPYGQYCGHPAALAMHPEIFKRISKREEGYLYLMPSEVGQFVGKFLIENGFNGTINVAGKNFAGFDKRFLEEQTTFFECVKTRHRVIDVATHFVDASDTCLPDLKTCLKRAGVIKEVAHDAIGDALDIVSLVRYTIGGMFLRKEIL